jgi:hypothetical protein
MRSRLGSLLAVVIALVAYPARADVTPNLATGIGRADEQVGDVDHVNLFNGNLAIVIPIGRTYPVGGTLSYRLLLAFNANAWHFKDCSNPPDVTTCTDAEPDPSDNAGFGWTLSLGRLISPGDPLNDTGGWIYVDPNGGQHEFSSTLHNNETATSGVFYTRDSTYIRMKLVGAAHLCSGTLPAGEEIEMPNGVIHRFGQDGQLVQMRDRFANSVCVTTGALQTTIQDSQGRVQTISYVADAVFGKLVSSAKLTSPAGTSTYSFGYTPQTVDKPCPFADPTGTLHSTVYMNLLSSVSIPEGLSYSMPSYATVRGSSCTAPGSIQSMGTPYGATVSWTYQSYKFPAQNKIWRSFSNGVATRTASDASGHQVGQWTYASLLESATFPQHPNLLTNTMSVSGSDGFAFSETHYFSVSLDSTGTWDIGEYGLPINHYKDDGNGHPLSVEHYSRDNTLLRRDYVAYDIDQRGGSDIADATQNNPRPQYQRTSYEDDGHYSDITYSSFDNIGHYRTATTGGNFDTGNVRTVTSDYDAATGSAPAPPLPVGSPWILGTVDRVDVSENGVTARREMVQDPATGFLSRERIYTTGISPSAHDVVVEYLTGDGQGNVTSERFYGADTGSVPTGSLAGLRARGASRE